MGIVFALLVLGLCVIGAIWESVRVRKDFKKLEQQMRRWLTCPPLSAVGRGTVRLLCYVRAQATGACLHR